MTDKAQDPEITDYGDPVAVRARYEATKKELALLKENSPKPTAGIPSEKEVLPGPPAALQTPTVPTPTPAAPAPAHERYVATIPMALHPMHATVDDLKELERFRLGVWLAKGIFMSMAFLIVSSVVLYIYTAYETNSLPDLSVLGTVFGHLKEILVVIVESNK